MFRVRDPHNLHLCIFSGQAKMNLLVSWLKWNFDLGKSYKLLESYFFVTIGVEEVKDGLCVRLLDIMLRFDIAKVCDEIFERSLSIFILIIGVFPEIFEVLIANLSWLCHKNQEKKA